MQSRVARKFARGLNAILPAAYRSFLSALVANALDDKSVVANSKPVGSSDFIADFDDLFAGELDQFPALGTVQMVVFGISIVEFIHASAVEFEAVKQPGVDELTKGAIDGGAGHVIRATLGDIVRLAFGWQLIDQLIGIEVLMPIEDLFEQILFLVGIPKPSRLKELFIASQRGHGDRDRSQRFGFCLWFGYCQWFGYWRWRVRHGEGWI